MNPLYKFTKLIKKCKLDRYKRILGCPEPILFIINHKVKECSELIFIIKYKVSREMFTLNIINHK